MIHCFRLATCVVSLCLAGPALAQETQTFTYDVHGRLTTVVRTSGATTRTTTYALDNADNRSQRATTVASPGGMAAASNSHASDRVVPTRQDHATTRTLAALDASASRPPAVRHD